jgi:hypothetical protein
MGPSFCTSSGAGGGRGLAMTAGCCGCWPRGVGTTVPCCTRGTGAGAVGRWAVCEDGQGGSGVLEQAVSSTAASIAVAFQCIGPDGGCVGAEATESESLRLMKVCMVMVVSADGCHAGRRLLRGCYLRAHPSPCQRTSRCKRAIDTTSYAPAELSWRRVVGVDYNAPRTGVDGACICTRSNARTKPWSERVRSRPSCRWSLK